MFGVGSGSSQTWIWNGLNWIQRFPTNSPPIKYAHAMSYDPIRGETVVFGGFIDGDIIQMANDTWVWNGINWAQRFPNTSPSRRAHYGMSYSPQGILLFGGSEQFGDGGSAFNRNDTWIWTGTNWVLQQPAVKPPTTADDTLAFDPIRQEVVLAAKGEFFVDNVAQTWVWKLRKLSGQTTSP